MVYLQLCLVVSVVGCVLAYPQYPASLYGIPVIHTVYTPVAPTRSFPGTPVTNQFSPSRAQFTHAEDSVPTLNDSLELLPPLQHVVGTRYPQVAAGSGYRFPTSQLRNPTPPPNIH